MRSLYKSFSCLWPKKMPRALSTMASQIGRRLVLSRFRRSAEAGNPPRGDFLQAFQVYL